MSLPFTRTITRVFWPLTWLYAVAVMIGCIRRERD